MIYTVTFNPAIDYVVRLDSPLEVGEVNRARGEDCVLGGKGINVSGVLAELGCKSVALGFVAGETGAWLERGLAAQGIQTDFIHLAQGMTRINVKIKAGQETELNGAGPNIPESAMQALEAKLDALQNGDILILAGSIPASLAQTTYERLLARLQGRGVRAVVDATRDLLVNVLQYHPFLIKPNNHELGEIVGKVLKTEEEIIAAAKATHAHSFIKRLPQGYDTVVREDGDNLSQGQKQLLCITRVMLCQPPMLILDEATSSIDTRTEIRIQRAFEKLMKGRTSFIVAHRLSTIKNADIILVMKDGNIIEQGSHESLLAQNGFYANLYNSQFA